MSSGLAFTILGRWTGGKQEEDEMRRLMTQEPEAAKAHGEIFEETRFHQGPLWPQPLESSVFAFRPLLVCHWSTDQELQRPNQKTSKMNFLDY